MSAAFITAYFGVALCDLAADGAICAAHKRKFRWQRALAAAIFLSFMVCSPWVESEKVASSDVQTPRYSCRRSMRAGSSDWVNSWMTWPCSITRKRSASGAAKRKFCSTITMV